MRLDARLPLEVCGGGVHWACNKVSAKKDASAIVAIRDKTMGSFNFEAGLNAK